MENENEYAPVDVVEQEETTSGTDIESDTDFGQEEDTITIPKDKFNAIRRKAMAFDAKKDKPVQKINNRSDDAWKQRMELKVDGYVDDEVDFILKNGGKKALENPLVKGAIETLRTQKKAEAAILGSEGQKSSTERRLSQSEFSKLSSTEQLKALSELN